MKKINVPVNSKEVIVINHNDQDIEIEAEEGATANVLLIQNDSDDKEIKNKVLCNPGKDATINFNFFVFGGKNHKIHVENYLKEEGGCATNNGIFLGSGDQNFDIKTSSFHRAPHTECNMVVKGALKDSSRTDYEGLVDISKEGENCRGFQKEETLLLSDKAKAHALPLLDVNNNNVEVKHGATIGRIDKERLFFIQSRGLSELESKIKMVEGFFNPLINNLDENKKDEIMNTIRNKMVN